MIAFLLLITLVVVLYFAYWKKKDKYIDAVEEKVASRIKSRVIKEKPDTNIEGLIYKKYKI